MQGNKSASLERRNVTDHDGHRERWHTWKTMSMRPDSSSPSRQITSHVSRAKYEGSEGNGTRKREDE